MKKTKQSMVRVKRYVQVLTPQGDVTRTIDLQSVSKEEEDRWLACVFQQAMERLGYAPVERDGKVL